MKCLIIMCAVMLSANTFAGEFFLTTSVPFALTSYDGPVKAAVEVMNDAEEFRLSGELSVALAQKISDLQALVDVSNEEAIDLLTADAAKVLENR